MLANVPSAISHTPTAPPIKKLAGVLNDGLMTTGAESQNLSSEDHRLHSGNIEPLSASRILALHHVIEASHVRLRLGKLGAIAFIGVSAQRLLLGAD
jgi:hypothetical protein